MIVRGQRQEARLELAVRLAAVPIRIARAKARRTAGDDARQNLDHASARFWRQGVRRHPAGVVHADEIDDRLSHEADAVERARLDDIVEHHVVHEATKFGGVDIGTARHPPAAYFGGPIIEQADQDRIDRCGEIIRIANAVGRKWRGQLPRAPLSVVSIGRGVYRPRAPEGNRAPAGCRAVSQITPSRRSVSMHSALKPHAPASPGVLAERRRRLPRQLSPGQV